MAWIESHQELRDHPKLLDLAERMGWSRYETIGRLHCLWWWCQSFAEDGDLRKHDAKRLGKAVGLESAKQTAVFIGAATETGWIDRKPYARIHDWWDYIGPWLQSKYKRSPHKWEQVRNRYVTVTSPLRNRTPNLTNRPTSKEPAKPAAGAADNGTIRTFIRRTTALLKHKQDKPLELGVKSCYRQYKDLLIQHPHLLEPLLNEIAGLPMGMPEAWYMQAIRGKINAMTPGPGVRDVDAVLRAAGERKGDEHARD